MEMEKRPKAASSRFVHDEQIPMSQKLVIHVPHASTSVPSEYLGQFLISETDLEGEVFASADLWTDQLAREAWPDATIVEAQVSRIVLDVERYAIDELEPMSRVGRGMIYEKTISGNPLRRPVLENERQQMQSTLYDPHWAQLRAESVGATLIDLHSYPLDPWTIEIDSTSERPEIVLGTDARLTPSGWRAALVTHFEKAGFSVGLDRPYGGVIDAGSRVAVMFEIRRDILGSGPGSPEWDRMVSVLKKVPLEN